MEYSGLARGKKRNRSLLELMDAEGDYQAPVGTGKAAPNPAEQGKSSKIADEKAVKEPAVKEKLKEEADKEQTTEPLATVGEGKIHLELSYPLAVMLAFMAVVTVICAVLVGWKLGRDRTEEKYRDLLLGQQPRIENTIPGMELKDSAENLER